MCGRTAVIPLRMTALYAHDGDRWVQVFEHLSFGARAGADADATASCSRQRQISAERRRRRELADELSRRRRRCCRAAERVRSWSSLDPSTAPRTIRRSPRRRCCSRPIRTASGTAIETVERSQLVDGTLRARGPPRRHGRAERSARRRSRTGSATSSPISPRARASPAGKVRLRGTFVFEKRDRTRRQVGVRRGQGHLSQPIDDNDLAHACSAPRSRSSRASRCRSRATTAAAASACETATPASCARVAESGAGSW